MSNEEAPTITLKKKITPDTCCVYGCYRSTYMRNACSGHYRICQQNNLMHLLPDNSVTVNNLDRKLDVKKDPVPSVCCIIEDGVDCPHPVRETGSSSGMCPSHSYIVNNRDTLQEVSDELLSNNRSVV